MSKVVKGIILFFRVGTLVTCIREILEFFAFCSSETCIKRSLTNRGRKSLCVKVFGGVFLAC